MRKLSLIVICALTAVLFASCQTGEKKDKNGDTPETVVKKMYQALQDKDYDKVASFSKIPDTVKIEKSDLALYKEFQNNAQNKNGKIVILGEDWSKFIVNQMKQDTVYKLDKYEIVSEEISKTDPNSAKVKTKIQVTTSAGQSEAECSFPLKKEDNVWLIIG